MPRPWDWWVGFRTFRRWTPGQWLVATVVTALAAVATGIPTGVVQTSLYRRMTPVTWWDYPLWAASAILVGLVAATYLQTRRVGNRVEGRLIGGGVLATFAIGCPTCNKIVVALIGTSGALDYWAPLQPLVGLGSVAMLGVALVVRLRGEQACAWQAHASPS